MRISFFISTEIVKLNTLEMFGNHQIEKLNTRKMYFFLSAELSNLESINSTCFQASIFIAFVMTKTSYIIMELQHSMI